MAQRPPTRSTDDLAARVARDREAFAALYDLYYPKILGYCIRRLFSRSVAEDLTSDIFLNAATHVASFNGKSEGEFGGWLYTIATNQINGYLRSFERRRKLLESAASMKRFRSEQTHDDHDRLDWPTLYEAILQLKPRDQTLISLRFMQDLPHEEIAAIMNLQPGTVRVAISRALARLRDRFGMNEPISTKGD